MDTVMKNRGALVQLLLTVQYAQQTRILNLRMDVPVMITTTARGVMSMLRRTVTQCVKRVRDIRHLHSEQNASSTHILTMAFATVTTYGLGSDVTPTWRRATQSVMDVMVQRSPTANTVSNTPIGNTSQQATYKSVHVISSTAERTARSLLMSVIICVCFAMVQGTPTAITVSKTLILIAETFAFVIHIGLETNVISLLAAAIRCAESVMGLACITVWNVLEIHGLMS
jgi:ABC-type polysaccharide/polyol phosphate export permease